MVSCLCPLPYLQMLQCHWSPICDLYFTHRVTGLLCVPSTLLTLSLVSYLWPLPHSHSLTDLIYVTSTHSQRLTGLLSVTSTSLTESLVSCLCPLPYLHCHWSPICDLYLTHIVSLISYLWPLPTHRVSLVSYLWLLPHSQSHWSPVCDLYPTHRIWLVTYLWPLPTHRVTGLLSVTYSQGLTGHVL